MTAPLDWGSTDLHPKVLRGVLGSYPTGVAIVATRCPDGRKVGLTINSCLLYTSPSPRDQRGSRMPSSA